jgi:cell fate (sporulation/competence/biofilm development) regulator YlbF (YheA/YmcA/DUF963 family)
MTIREQAYIDLEAKSIQEKYTHNLSAIFQNARDTLTKNGETDEAIKAQYEIDFLNFNINDNKLSFLYSGTNDKGQPFEYPSLKLFTEDTFDYLIDRQKSAKAENLKARYSHILWLSPKKKIEYAQTAIDNYLKLIKIREKQDSEFPNEHFGLKVLENIKNAFLLSLTVKYKVETTKKEVLRLVKKYSFKSSSAYALKMQLIRLMLEQKSVFKEADFNGIVKVCEQMISNSYPTNKHSVIDILNLIIKVEKKLKNETAKYEKRIAEMWEELSYDREDETNLVSSDFCKNALKIYKKLKETDKVKELERRFNELRKNIKLSSFGQEIDMTEIMETFRDYADKLTDNDPFVIINSLMTDKGLLPTIEEVEKQAKETNKHSFLSHLANTSILDRNGNTAQYFNDKEEYEYYEILQSYHFSLELTKSNLIREIIFAGIKKGKLNANTFLSFLQQYSWLGKELEMSSNGGKPIPYCWLALIAPALNEYFTNLEFYFRNQANYPNFILCIDSLSLKIEGMLRDICEFKGITTFELKPDKKGRTISQEKDIHKLLYEPEITDLIDKDDLLFFKFLLVEKAGYNLRHRVAHSLMTFYEYHINLMNLLIMAVLKFGKYNFVTATKNESE